MNTNIGIVLIHGAGLNNSIWDGLKSEINQTLLTIDFPNRKMSDNANQTLTFDDYVNSTIEQIKNWKADNFIIVAHSIGACVGLKVAEQFKNELKGFERICSYRFCYSDKRKFLRIFLTIPSKNDNANYFKVVWNKTTQKVNRK